MEIRRGGLDDLPSVLAMLDGAVEWLGSKGITGQWGTEPWSTNPDRVRKVTEKLRDETVWIAEVDGEPAGALTHSERPMEYVPQVTEPELYIRLLVTSRKHSGKGVGSALLDHARAQAREQRVDLVRVDCYAGGDGRLAEYYQRNGFQPVREFTVGDWPGLLLSDRVGGSTAG